MIAQGQDRPPGPLRPAAHSRPRRRILGLPVDDLGWEDCLDLLQAWIAEEDRPEGPRQVITLNPEHVMAARRNPAFRSAIEAADLVTCDGVGLAWAGRRLGQPLRAVIPGSELMPRLAERLAPSRSRPPDRAAGTSRGEGAGRPARWYFLGGSPGVAERAAAALVTRHTALTVAGCHGGSPRDEDLPAIQKQLAEAAPIDVLWVAYGSPAQELWIHRHRARLPVRLAVGVGGAFDFLAGTAPRPPAWVKQAGLIWLYRLLRQPGRWRRQAVLPAFVLRVLVTAWRGAASDVPMDGS